MPLVFNWRSLAASLFDGIAEAQERLNFCAERGVTAAIEMIHMQDINASFERLLKADVNYLFVIHMASLKAETVK